MALVPLITRHCTQLRLIEPPAVVQMARSRAGIHQAWDQVHLRPAALWHQKDRNSSQLYPNHRSTMLNRDLNVVSWLLLNDLSDSVLLTAGLQFTEDELTL